MNMENAAERILPGDFNEKKKKFFSALALSVKRAFELHKEFGLLKESESESFRNVSEHCLVVAARSGVLGDWCGLPGEVKDDLVAAAALHDFYKKRQIEKAEGKSSLSIADYEASEKEAGQAMKERGVPERIRRYVRSVGSLPSVVKEIKAILEKENLSDEDTACLIIHYVDSYTRGSMPADRSEIGPDGRAVNDLNRRISAAKSNPKYNDINEGGKKYFGGKTSYEVQEEVGEEVEKRLADEINQRTGRAISAKKMPEIVEEEIIARIGKL